MHLNKSKMLFIRLFIRLVRVLRHNTAKWCETIYIDIERSRKSKKKEKNTTRILKRVS